MEELYIIVINANTIRAGADNPVVIMNQKIGSSRYWGNGFSFQVLYCKDDYFQIKVYAFDTCNVLDKEIFERKAAIIGGKMGVPVYYSNKTHYVDDYIFMISRKPERWESVCQALETDDLRISSEGFNRKIQNRIEYLERVYGFDELSNYVESNPELHRSTRILVDETSVYGENYISRVRTQKKGLVRFDENLTLNCAKEAVENGMHTAVLNFANPVEPGGGILRGANAQEENLCRSTNLYQSLISLNAKDYYQSNNQILDGNQFNSMFLGTDRVIYSPGVMVLKESSRFFPIHSQYLPEYYINKPFTIDVLTCAAPFFSGLGYILPNGDLQHLLERRIRNIFEVAIEKDIEAIVLGAFGCGAFHNPPDIVADAFRAVLLEPRYRNAFDEVIFAVKRTGFPCANIEAFERNFSFFPVIDYHGKEKMIRE